MILDENHQSALQGGQPSLEQWSQQGKNLHALWDGLVELKYDDGEIQCRKFAITSKPRWNEIQGLAKVKKTSTLLKESVSFARSAVDDTEVLNVIQAFENGTVEKLEEINLSVDYLKAGGVAEGRISAAAVRLAQTLSDDLDGSYDLAALQLATSFARWSLSHFRNRITIRYRS